MHLGAGCIAVVAVAAGGAVNTSTLVTKRVVRTGSVNKWGSDCQPQSKQIFHMAPFD
jgi:putative component of membrane protein insertase Oxa1/YidC/SpoIIIJ protein YidD